MGTLFDLTAEAQELYQIATDEDVDEQIFNDSLESIMGEIEVKSAGYASVIERLDMEMKKADEISKRYASVKKSRENAIKRMKDRLLKAMDALGKKELPAGDFTIKIQKNGGQQPLEITGDVPEKFNKITIEPDNDKIREYLKDNTCDWAALKERGRHISIK